jgi:hypothetical protein
MNIFIRNYVDREIIKRISLNSYPTSLDVSRIGLCVGLFDRKILMFQDNECFEYFGHTGPVIRVSVQPTGIYSVSENEVAIWSF